MTEEQIPRRAREEAREDLVEAVRRFAEAIGQQRTWMDAKAAADFLGMRWDEFRRDSDEVPKHRLPDGRESGVRPRYRYYAPELTEWLLAA
jgi:hypothetical protein